MGNFVMWKGSYGKEPFDLRLTLLRMWKRMPRLLLYTAIGTALFGGAYYVKNVVFRPERTYCAESAYKIEFARTDWAQYGTYINETTWNTWVHTDEFLGNVQGHLREQGGAALSKEEISEALSAKLASDLRIPSTIVVTGDPRLSESIAAAVEETMTREFAVGVSDDIAGIRVIDPGVAKEVLWDVRPGRAFLLGAALSALFVFGVFLLREIGDDSIWLPAILRSRYGLSCIGTADSPECAANMAYLLRGKKEIALCPAQEDIDPAEVERALKNAEETAGEKHSFRSFPSPVLCPEECQDLRQAEAVVLVVRAGEGVGRQVEYVLDFLREQDISVTAALLWQADETLIRRYYRFRRDGEQA